MWPLSGKVRSAKKCKKNRKAPQDPGENKNGKFENEKHRHRILGAVLFVLYLVLLTYFLFFAEEMGRSPDARAEYSYNLTLFKEIRRFILYRDILGWRAVFGIFSATCWHLCRWLFAGHLGSGRDTVYHRDLKLCHESSPWRRCSSSAGWKFLCG